MKDKGEIKDIHYWGTNYVRSLLKLNADGLHEKELDLDAVGVLQGYGCIEFLHQDGLDS